MRGFFSVIEELREAAAELRTDGGQFGSSRLEKPVSAAAAAAV